MTVNVMHNQVAYCKIQIFALEIIRCVPIILTHRFVLIFCTLGPQPFLVSCPALCVFGEGSGICHLAEERMARGRAL